MKVYAAFVTYHPDQERFDLAFKSVEPQVQKVIVVDNTPHNEGIARALNKAFSQAESEGCDWLITFDQDSIAPTGLVGKLMDDVLSNGDVGQIGPAYTGFNSKGTGVVDVDHIITSGSLTSVSAWKSVGGFREDYFIDNVDIEFSYRLQQKGYRVLLDNGVILDHRLGEGLTGWMLNGKLRLGFLDHQPVRWYYIVRNTLAMRREYSSMFPESTSEAMHRMRKNCFRMVLVGKGRWLRIKMIVRAVLDYHRGRMGVLR